MIEGIVAQTIGPAVQEIGAFGGMGVEPPESGFAATCRFEMHETGKWRPERLETEIFEPQTEVHIVELDRQMNFVEAAGCKKFRALHGKTGARHSRYFVNRAVAAEPAHSIRRETRVAMTGARAHADDDPGVLDAPIGVEQQAADCADARIACAGGKLFDPAGLGDFDVIIKENQYPALRRAGPEIAKTGEIKVARRVDPGHSRIAFGFGERCQRRPLRAAVVDEDDIERRVIGSLQNARDASAQQVRGVAGGHDDGDAWRFNHFRTRRGRRGAARTRLRFDQRTRNVQNVRTPQIAQDFPREVRFPDGIETRRKVAAGQKKPRQQQSPDIGAR